MSTPTIKLDKLCDLVSVQVKPADMPDAPYLGLEHLEPGRLLPTGFGGSDEVGSHKSVFKPGDVLYGKLRPYLDKAVLADREGIATTELLVLRPKPWVTPEYLVCVLHSPTFIDFAMQGVTGAQHPRTSWGHVRNFELPDWGVRIQESIAGLLWSLYRLRMATEAAIESASGLKRSAMRQLFSRGLRGEAQKDTRIGPIPASWEASRLDAVADVISTRMSYAELLRAQPSTGANAIRVLGIKVSDMNALGNEVEISQSALDVMVDRDVAELRCAPPGAIIFPKRGAAIATNKKRIARTWTVFDPNVIGVVAHEGLHQRLLFHWFQAFDLRTITEPGPTPQLNKKNLVPLLVPVPPAVEEQQEIVEVLDALDHKIALHRRKREVIDQLFRSLLHKLMIGEMAVDGLDLCALPKLEGSAA